MNTEDKKQGNIRARQKLIDDANKKIKSSTKFSSLPHAVKLLLCKEFGLKVENY